MLFQPFPMLGGQSPKKAARSKAGRRDMPDWLKYLENGAAHRAQGHPFYDLGWMWEALKSRTGGSDSASGRSWRIG
jgi:hypothetical protein